VAGIGVVTDDVLGDSTDFTPADGTFALSTNSNGSTTLALDASPPAATPEPSGLLLLSTGLLGAAGMVIRKRRILS
jgi:hypothetical protein